MNVSFVLGLQGENISMTHSTRWLLKCSLMKAQVQPTHNDEDDDEKDVFLPPAVSKNRVWFFSLT